MKKLNLFVLATAMLALSIQACKKRPSESNSQVVSLDLPVETAKYYPPNKIVVANQNEIATLGRVLFYDKHLSLNNARSCASCHRQEFAFADNVAFSKGFENRLTGRNSMPLQNITFSSNSFTLNIVGDHALSRTAASLFWDGRETELEDLIARPLTNHVEMGIDDVNTLPAKLATLPYYEKLFTDAYGTKEISFEKIANSISFFVASIKSADTRLDRYNAGKLALNAEELHGQVLFNTKYNCATCHRVDTSGYRGTDFMDIGLARKNADDGLGGITQQQEDMNTFRIPNLRNVGLTAPYMHDGRFASLHQVLDHYSSGIDSTPNLHSMLRNIDGRPIRMNISASEKDAIVAFLNTLTDYTMVTDAKYSDPFRLK